MMEKYTVKEVMQTFGISRSTLLYYERQGIIHSEKNSKNGYRSYSHAEISTLKKCLCLKNLGFTTVEAADMLLHEDILDQDHLKAYAAKLTQDIQIKKAMLKEIQQELAHWENPPITWEILEVPEYSVLLSGCEKGYHEIHQSREADLLIRKIPLTCFITLYDNIFNNCDDFCIGRCLPSENLPLLFDSEAGIPWQKIGGGSCLRITLTNQQLPEFARNHERIKQDLAQFHLTPQGSAFTLHPALRKNSDIIELNLPLIPDCQ